MSLDVAAFLQMSTRQGRGLCLLSLDAGGLRATSQLAILVSLMDRLSSEEVETELPCNVFDIIGGTGSGGFITILLVVLGLNARKALEEFTYLNEKVLERGGMTDQTRTAELKTHIDDLLERHEFSSDVPLLASSERSRGCKLAVPISYKYDVGSTCTLRNFEIRHEKTLDITIAEALLVTLATPPLFIPTSIFKDASTSEYISGDWAISNPVQEVISEAHNAFGSEELVACLLSIGCGHSGVVVAPNSPDTASWNHFLEQLVSSSEKMAQSIGSQMGNLGIYYRFSVPTGLESSMQKIKKGVEETVAHTTLYLKDFTVSQKVDRCVDFLKIRDGISSLERLKYSSGARVLPPSLPPLTSTFVMREKPWDFIEKALLGTDSPTGANGPRMLVVTGMAGCGKTQIILKFMLEHQERFASQFFIDSSNRTRLCADVVRHVRSLGTEHSQKTFAECLLFLAQPSSHGPRLILYDNVDDPNLELALLLPRGKSCMIIITSRDRMIGGLCPRGHLELDVMSVEEAMELLLHTADEHADITDQDRNEARDIAEALGCLPLALQQARSYMFQTKCSAKAYLERLSSSRDALLSDPLRNQLDGSSVSTYAAFDASFKKLTSRTQGFLRLLSCFHWGSFPRELIILAAKYEFSDYETKYVDHGDEFETSKVVLEGIFLRDGIWDVSNIDDMTTALQNYSLVTLLHGVATMLLQMHPVVHSWVRWHISEEEREKYHSAAVLLLVLGARFSHTPSARYLESHAMHMFGIWDRLDVNDAEGFALILSQGGSFEEARQLRERVVAELQTQIDPQTIPFSKALQLLAVTYSDLGLFAKAQVLQAQVVDLRKRFAMPSDAISVAASSSLADTYRRLRRFEEAEKLQIEVLTMRKETLGEQDLDTVDALSQLALTYFDWGRFGEAEERQVQALKIIKEKRGEGHPKTLIASGDLANTYLKLLRANDALPIQQEVVRLSKETRGERHPETSKAMTQLAHVYSALGYFHTAEALQEEVLALCKEMRGERHPVTITACHDLATIYYELGRFKEAGTLQEEVLKLRKQVLGGQHLDTMVACILLARIYFGLGYRDEGVRLMDDAWRGTQDVLGHEHPDTLATAISLAGTYIAVGMPGRARPLLSTISILTKKKMGPDHPDSMTVAYCADRVSFRPVKLKDYHRIVELREQLLGDRHPDTITSMHEFALECQRSGRLWRAEKTFLSVLKLRKEILGDRHEDTLATYTALALTYLASGRTQKAEKFQLEVVKILKETRGDRHPETIRAQGSLAYIYYDLGRLHEAETLEEDVLKLEMEVFGKAKPAGIKQRIEAGMLGKLQNGALRVLSNGLFWVERLFVDEYEIVEIPRREREREIFHLFLTGQNYPRY